MSTDDKKPEEKKDMPAEKPAEDKPAEKPATEKPEAKQEAAPQRGDNRGGQGRGGRGGRGNDNRRGGGRKGGRRRRRDDKPQDEFDSTILDLARVTRVMAGGKRMSFRACVIIGDKKGRIGMGVKKGADVQLAVQKATDYAKKHLVHVKLDEGTIPHTVSKKFKGAQVLLKPAKAGTGVIAGGPVRVIMELAGISNIVAKMQGSKNKVNNATAVIEALRGLKTKDDVRNMKKAD